MAFQIKDDFLIMQVKRLVNQPVMISKKKNTLPLIYTLKNCDKETRREIIYIIKNKNTDTQSKKSGGYSYQGQEELNMLRTK